MPSRVKALLSFSPEETTTQGTNRLTVRTMVVLPPASSPAWVVFWMWTWSFQSDMR